MKDDHEVNRKDNEKNQQIANFEQQNKASQKNNEKAIKQIKINQAWLAGRPKQVDAPEEITTGSDNEMKAPSTADEQKVIANLIFSTIQGLVPHFYAKNPDVSIIPAKKVAPVDGDANEEKLYETAKQFGETAEIVLQQSLVNAGLKKCLKAAVRSALTSRIAVIKVGYEALTNENNTVLKGKIESTQEQIQTLETLKANIEDGSEDQQKIDVKMMQFTDTVQSLQSQQREIVSEGLILDRIPIEYMRWDSSVELYEIERASWMAHYTYMTVLEAQAQFGINPDPNDETIKERIKSWSRFSIKNKDGEGAEYTKDDKTETDDNKRVRVWERWDRRTMSVYTWIEGDTEYCKDPFTPKEFKGIWFPFFYLGLYWLDGKEWPVSMVELLIELQEEYDGTRRQLKEHRVAALPYTLADAGLLDAEEFKIITKNIGVRDVAFMDFGGRRASELFAPGPTVSIDPNLYDLSPILTDMQWVSGLQDANRGAVLQAKTLGEAEILENGLANRTEESRDEIESFSEKINTYSLGCLLEYMSYPKVEELAGPNLYWPEDPSNAQEFLKQVQVDIKAGSTGKPNQQREMKTWFENLEALLGLIGQVQQARDEGIDDSDNPYYLAIEMTLKRLDERLDVMTLLPKQKVPLIDQILEELVQTGIMQQIDIQQLPALSQYIAMKQQKQIEQNPTQQNEAQQ